MYVLRKRTDPYELGKQNDEFPNVSVSETRKSPVTGREQLP